MTTDDNDTVESWLILWPALGIRESRIMLSMLWNTSNQFGASLYTSFQFILIIGIFTMHHISIQQYTLKQRTK